MVEPLVKTVVEPIGQLRSVALRSDHPEDSTRALAELLGKSQVLRVEFTDCVAVSSYALVVDVAQLKQVLARRQELGLRPLELTHRHLGSAAAVVRHESGVTLMLVQCGSAVQAVASGATPARSDPLDHSTGLLFADAPKQKVQADRQKLASLYRSIGRTADDLPYTPEFEQLFNDYTRLMPQAKIDHAEVWRHLLTMRKAGQLPKLGPARTAPPETTPQELEYLKELLGTDIGKRDRLPYSEKFCQVHEAFNASFQKNRRRTISPHQLWRLIATLAK